MQFVRSLFVLSGSRKWLPHSFPALREMFKATSADADEDEDDDEDEDEDEGEDAEEDVHAVDAVEVDIARDDRGSPVSGVASSCRLMRDGSDDAAKSGLGDAAVVASNFDVSSDDSEAEAVLLLLYLLLLLRDLMVLLLLRLPAADGAVIIVTSRWDSESRCWHNAIIISSNDCRSNDRSLNDFRMFASSACISLIIVASTASPIRPAGQNCCLEMEKKKRARK